MKIIKNILNKCPLVLKRKYLKLVNDNKNLQNIISNLELKQEKELKEISLRFNNIFERVGNIDWRYYEHDSYKMLLTFNPRAMMRGYCDQEELKLIAREMGKRVEWEIASCKFIEKASSNKFN